jgi:hypothetical protein
VLTEESNEIAAFNGIVFVVILTLNQ